MTRRFVALPIAPCASLLLAACAHLPIDPRGAGAQCGPAATIRIARAQLTDRYLAEGRNGAVVVRVVAPTWRANPATLANVYAWDRESPRRYRRDTSGLLVYRQSNPTALNVQVGKLRYTPAVARITLRTGYADTLEFHLSEAWQCGFVTVD